MSWDGLGAAELERLVAAPLVELRDSIGSTLDLAHDLAARDAPDGTLVLADAQTMGRGRQGRSWESPAGAGIWLAVVLRPRPPVSGGALAIRAGLACVEALAAVSSAFAPRLKWPNDVMVLDRKAAGVLCEARWTHGFPAWIAVGVGINVRGPVPPSLRDRAVALDDVVPGTARPAVLAALVPRLAALSGRAGPLDDLERERYRRLAWEQRGESVEGVAPDGALLVRRGAALERRLAAP